MISSPITSLWIDGGKVEIVSDFIFFGSKINADGNCSHKIKTLAPWKNSYDKPRQHIKKQRHHFATKICKVKAMVFPVIMYGCESWAIKKAQYQGTDAFKLWYCRRLLRVPWTARRSKQSILKEINPLTGRAEAEAPVFWPPDGKSWLVGKNSDAGKYWGQEEKGTTEDEMVGWHHWLNGHKFEQTQRDSEGQGSLVCCSTWGHKELDVT